MEVQNRPDKFTEWGGRCSPRTAYISIGAGIVGLIVFMVVIIQYVGDSGSTSPVEPGPSAVKIHLLHINDAHGHLDAEDLELDPVALGIPLGSLTNLTENATLHVKYGGYPMVAQAIAERATDLKKSAPVFKFHAGDALTGSLYYSLLNSEADAAVMKKVCFDTFTPGNHEFDDGDTNLATFLDRLENVSAGECAPPAILGANIRPGPDSKLQGRFLNHKIIERGGVKLGVIGVDTKFKTEEASSPDIGTTLEDEKTAAQREINALTAKGIKHIVLISHIGYKNDLRLAKELTNVDVIIGGDSHSLFSSNDDTTAFLRGDKVEDYPAKEGNVCVVQSWEYAHVLGELTVDFDENGVVKSCTGKPNVPLEKASLYQKYKNSTGTTIMDKLVPADNEVVYNKIKPVKDVMFVDTSSQAYKEVKAILDAYASTLDSSKYKEVGNVKEELKQKRIPGGQSDTYKHGGQVAPAIGQIYTLSMHSACIGLIHAGSVRTSIAQGMLTYGSLFTVLPFFDTLVEIDISGAKLKEAMNQALTRVAASTDNSGSFPYAWGLKYDVDMTKELPLQNVMVNCRLNGTWTALEDDKEYKIVVAKFISNGKDGYTALGEVPEDKKLETGKTDVQTVASYLQKQDMEPVAEENQPVQKYIDANGCDHSLKADCVASLREDGVRGEAAIVV